MALAQECAEMIGSVIHEAFDGGITPVLIVDKPADRPGFTVDLVAEPAMAGAIIGMLVAKLLEVEERKADAEDASRN